MLEVVVRALVIPIIKITIVLGVVSLAVPYIVLLERKVLGFIQSRLGPRRVGFHGVLQPIADGIKLFIKEDVMPAGADRFVFMLAPIIVIVSTFTTLAFVPFGPDKLHSTRFFGLLSEPVSYTPWLVSEVNVGLLLLLAISSLGVYGIVFAGWSSRSGYSTLGGLRSTSQMISYEIPLILSLIGPLMLASAVEGGEGMAFLRLDRIVEAQRQLGMWFLWPQLVAFFIFVTAALAESNRLPFDLPEAESELVAGFHTEYSGMKFAFFFLAEYTSMIVLSALCSIIFLGGYLPPFVGVPWLAFFSYVPPTVWFLGKIVLCLYVYIWLRGTFPRYRYDQLMAIGWKVLLPLALFNILGTGLVIVLKA